MINKLLCNEKCSLIEAWKIINDNSKGVVFVINDENKLVGVITDGDIRRFMLAGGNLEGGIIKLMNIDFVYASQKDTYKELRTKINDKVSIIPIVNFNSQVVDYFEYNNSVNIPMAIPNLRGNEFKYLTDAFLSTWISSSGEYITKFENSFSRYCDTKYGVTVSNGTVALHLALVSLGIGEGDEVIVPDLTFAATINSVLHAGATPVIVDVEYYSWCIDPVEIEKAITPKTKAIIPVHIYGQPCDMEAIMKIAQKKDIYVIEDCAEAHGATYKGKRVGSFGDIGCFSFYGNKVITTGEGGMCVTNNKELDDTMRVLRDHGMSKTKRYWHDVVGYNYRMTNLQAAIGLGQLERIDEIHNSKAKLEELYYLMLKNVKGLSFQSKDLSNRSRITWLVSVLFENSRDKIISKLQKVGIDVRPFFYPLSEMKIYKKFVFSNDNSCLISRKGINLPTNNSVNVEIVNIIKNVILETNVQ